MAIRARVFNSDTVRIPLSQGKFALVDREDFIRVAEYQWHVAKKVVAGREYFYAKTNIDKKTVWLHRFILNVSCGILVDHRNRDGLDCRRSNLREATYQQNRANARYTKSKYVGVTEMPNGRFRARIQRPVNGKRVSFHLGYFDTAKEAAKAYNVRAKQEYGEFAVLNLTE